MAEASRSGQLKTAFDHCAALVRDEYRVRYASRLYLPEAYREPVLVMDAFRLETYRIAFTASEPMPGEIRLQWWRDVLNGTRADEHAANPVALALGHVIDDAKLPKPAFERYLDALAFDLYHDPMPDLASFEGWIGETESFLMQNTALICGFEAGRELADSCGHSGMAIGIARLLRLIAFHRARGQVHLPPEVLQAGDLETAAWLDEHTKAHETVVVRFAELGLAHSAKARQAIRGLSSGKESRAVFLPLIEAEILLRAALRAPSNALEGLLDASPLRVQLQVMRVAAFGF